jgi:hypothetical protein
MSFGGGICGYCKVKVNNDTGSGVCVVKDAVAAMVVETTVKDEDDEFDARVGSEEYKKIHKDVVEYTTPIINALKALPIYYCHHIKKGLELGKIKDQKEEYKKNIKLIK